MNLASSELHSRQTELDKEATFKLPDLLPVTVVGKELVPGVLFSFCFVRSCRITHTSLLVVQQQGLQDHLHIVLFVDSRQRDLDNFTYLTILWEIRVASSLQ